MSFKTQWRMWAVLSGITLFFFLIVGRLFYWQIIAGDQLRIKASAQYSAEFLLPAARGQILASDGNLLVSNQSAFLVHAQPKEIADIAQFSQSVSKILSLDEGSVVAKLSAPGRLWVPLAHKVETNLTDKLRELHLSGLGFEKEPKRYYPEASMAAAILGFVGSDQNGNDKGYFGIEGYYDRELRGQDGRTAVERDLHGAPILIGEENRIEPEHGRTLVTWIDRTIQHIAERRLSEGIDTYGAKEGSVIIMDPKTGGIMAMASFPSYDPARFSSYEKNLYKNPTVATSFEPGSTFKVLVMSSALQEHLVTPATTIEETGPVQIGEYTIRTWDDKYRGVMTMNEVLQHSSNVGMVFIEKKLGKEKMLKYIHDFGFGDTSGIDLEEELSPQLRRDSNWGSIDLATASFGQGIAVTPVQMVRAVGALANDGWLMEPHIVKEIRDEKGRVVAIHPKKIRQVVSMATTKIITEMMVSAVDNGEAKWAKPVGYRIAGKTGTAQIPVAGHYDEKKTIASFVGFAPADDPRFVMLVTLREPSSSPWGSETAAPLFFTIARDIFSYLGIPPGAY